MHDIQEQLAEVERIHAEAQRHMDRFTGLLKTTYANPTPAAMAILRQEHRELNRTNALLEVELHKLKEKSQMKRASLLAVLVIVLMIAVSSFAVAQDVPLATNTIEGVATLVSSEPIPTPVPVATEVPADNGQPDSGISLSELMPYFTIIALAVLLAVVAVAGTAIVVAGQGMPKWSRDVLRAGLNQGFATLTPIVEATEGTADDELLAALHKKIDELFGRMDALTPKDKQPGDITAGAALGQWTPQYPVDDQPPQG